MKLFLLFIGLLIGIASEAQVIAQRYNFNPTIPILEQYVTNSPTNNIGSSRVISQYQDSTRITWIVDSIVWLNLGAAVNHGTPTGIIWTDANGLVRHSPIASIPVTSGQVTTGLGFTPYNATNPSGFMTASSTNTLTNKSGNISQWTNDASFITTSGARTAISLTTTGTSGAATYNNSTGVLNVPQYANSGGTVTSASFTSTDFAVTGSPITTSGTFVANLNTSGITAGTYSGLTVNNKGIATAGTTRSFNAAPARVLSTTGSDNTFTVSASRDAEVTYTINFAAALTLTTSNGVVTLDYSQNAGSTWQTLSRGSQTFGVSVTITTSQDQVLHGVVPAGALVRIFRSSNTNVTITLPTTSQQETLL